MKHLKFLSLVIISSFISLAFYSCRETNDDKEMEHSKEMHDDHTHHDNMKHENHKS